MTNYALNNWVAAKWLVALVLNVMLLGNVTAKELPVFDKFSGNFKLTSHLNKPVELKDFSGKIVLLNFGYTHCPDICPMVLARLSQLYRKLEDVSDQVQVLFISFDVERDTPEQLAAYLKFFNPDFIGLTGTAQEMAVVAKQYGAVYMKQDTGSEAGPLFSHSDFIYLIDEEGRVRALFSNDDTLEEMAADVRSLLD